MYILSKMKTLYRLLIDPTLSLESSWALAESNGIEILYGSEENETIELFAQLSSPEELKDLNWITDCTPHALPSIDWEAQWAAHGQDFHDGFVHVELSSLKPEAPILLLKPGPGFGDLSHPTTRLVLLLLSRHFHNQSVIDIGCGSGILSIAAAALGAAQVYGIDIDPEAITHSRQNANLNHVEMICSFGLTEDFTWQATAEPALILMNMIQSEQQVAWESLPLLHDQPAEYITSGIRVEDRDEYLALTSSWGWIVQDERTEEGWSAFWFKKKKGKTPKDQSDKSKTQVNTNSLK